ncbi:hypothetical protein BDW59DRAFT_42862 [Aspergillus cavernicola]|uniref:Uncharacterized protein n=1 Tax=Aspergillus cavernicola TaxID=176166 RepID=A0ABR4IP72_9EURO
MPEADNVCKLGKQQQTGCRFLAKLGWPSPHRCSITSWLLRGSHLQTFPPIFISFVPLALLFPIFRVFNLDYHISIYPLPSYPSGSQANRLL